jgi:hypothetical protein
MFYDARGRKNVISTSDARGRNSPTLMNDPCLSMPIRKIFLTLLRLVSMVYMCLKEYKYLTFKYPDLRNSVSFFYSQALE